MKLESGESAAPPKPLRKRKLKHTPGPWSTPHFAAKDCKCKCGYVLVEGHCGAVATVHYSGDRALKHGDNPPPGQAIANAYLISAAPDLLAELEHAHDMIKHYLKAGYLPHMSAEEAEQLVRNPDSAILRAREGR